MKKFLRVALILFIIGLVTGSGVYLYVFHKPHRNIAKEKAAYTLNADELYSKFASDETASNTMFGDQVVELTGQVVDKTVSDRNATLVLLDQLEGISCSFDSVTVQKQNEALNAIEIGGTITLKGKCDGFDMIMGVVLTRCWLIK